MKKFLAVFDGFNMSKSTLAYSIQIAQKADAHLVGLFLDEFVYRSYDVVKVMETHKNYKEKMKELDARDKKKRDEAGHHKDPRQQTDAGIYKTALPAGKLHGY